jgi:DNA-binding response OmpR family regulator
MPSSKRILIVDDDDDVVALLRDYFGEAGYHVDVALHGGDALTLVQHDPPDIVLLDIAMPGMDGVEVLQRIRAMHPTIPVIMLTARVDADCVRQTLAAGAFDYITKPFELASLHATVDTAVRTANKADEIRRRMTVAADLLRVLVIEDEQDVASVLADFVRELGGQALAVPTAEQALQALQAESIGLMMLDLRLPGMSGLDFLRRPEVRDSGIPVIVMSGVASEPEAREALQLGGLEFLQKPVTFNRLAGVLTGLDLYVLKRRTEWRRVPRAVVTFPVRVDTAWEWRALDLSPLGVKIPPQGWLRAGATVRVLLALPDGAPPLTVDAVLARTGPEGDVFSFINLDPTALQRLSHFVSRLRRQRQD